MTPGRALALAVVACAALAPGPGSTTGGFGSPRGGFGSPGGGFGSGGSARPMGPHLPRSGVTGGGAARQGIERLRAHEQRNRLEDLRRGVRRRLEADRLAPHDPLARERLERRWRAEDRATDFRRDREREAIERSVETKERLESSAERLPGGLPLARPDAEDRAAFERERRAVEEREQLERLRRDARRRLGVGPGAPRRWPR